MSKKEFLKNLEEALLEKMDISDAVEHIRYYNDYISNEVAKGKSEEDVISSLQSPRLIAKNITSNTDRASKYDSNISNTMYNKTYENSYDNSYENSYNNADNRTYSSGPSFSINGKPINGIIVKIVMIIIGIIVIGLLLVVFGVMTWLLLNVIIPIILVVFLVNLIKNIFSGKG